MLKSLDLFGFKSFADRTTFDFAPGVTCVVGPNGSGKSNVVDGLKWLLGDQSAKSLRGKEMTDVIFNGSAGRKPAGYAEATLTFDNSKGHLASEHREVLIGRRLYRSGESEYLINRQPVRLKDVRDLFLGTGAGTAAYSIIEQGRVDALLQTTTQNRRVVFEEAAGISRFNQRKQDALRRLERVGQNLVRLTDIVDEVKSQLDSVRSQAGKAARFREYSEELRRLRIGLAADDYRSMTEQLAAIKLQNDDIDLRVKDLTEQHQAAEAEQSAIDSKVAELEDQLRGAEKRSAENRESIAGHEATILHQNARQAELNAELERLQQQQTELSTRAQQAVGELEETTGTVQQFEEQVSTRQEELARQSEELRLLSEMIHDAREILEQDRARQLELLQLISILTNRKSSRRSTSDAQELTLQRLGQRADQLRQEESRYLAELEVARQDLQAATDQLTVLREEVRTARTRRAEMLELIETAQNAVRDQRERRSALEARRGLLEDLEQRQEGLGIGCKEILARAESDVAPWNTILGSVADLLIVDLEDAALLEVALGSRGQAIVVSDLQPLVEYLQSGRSSFSSRVGFVSAFPGDNGNTLWHDPQKSDQDLYFENIVPLEPIDLTGERGVRCRADKLVRSARLPDEFAARLLGDTWIVESLEEVLRLATPERTGCRFVTMQGELLDADGTLYAGILRQETALVPRKSELRGLKQDLIRLEQGIQQDEQRTQELQRLLANHESEQHAAEERLEQFSDGMTEQRSALGSRELTIERIRQELAEIDREREEIAARRRELQTDGSDADAEIAAAETELAELKQRIDQGEAELYQHDLVRNEFQERITQAQMDLVKQEERLRGLQNVRIRLDQECSQRDLHREESERRLALIHEKIIQIDTHLKETQAHLTELQNRQVVFHQEVQERQLARDEVRQLRSTLAERELRLRHERRELKERQHELELKVREIRQQMDHLTERIRDEYQVELPEAAASGESALRPAVAETVAESHIAGESDTSAESAEVPTDLVDGEISAEDSESEPFEVSAEIPEVDLQQLRREVEDRIESLRRKLKQIGNVNADALQLLDELDTRYQRLNGQLQDLVEAKNTLEEIVRKINVESKRLFLDSFEQIRKNFQELFRKLFGGGEGDVVLEDPEDVLDCGIEVVARPPGKELRSISLLSGGEKTLTAVALLMAIFKSKPSPFCILDEVDAALDEGNVERYMRVVQEFREWTQFIIISHSKRTMSVADVLYGVTMEESGVSKRMSVRFEDVGDDGHFKTEQGSEAA